MNRKVKQHIQSKVRQTQDISYNTVGGGSFLAIFAFSGILKEEGFLPLGGG